MAFSDGHRRIQELRKKCALCLMLLGLLCVTSLFVNSSFRVPFSDFTSYWVAGSALLSGLNPYDGQRAARIEETVGLASGSPPLIMRNPPWTVTFTIPLGMLGHSAAWLLWVCLLLGCVGLAVTLCWREYGGRAKGVLFATLFAPVLACLTVGQTSAFVLLGFVLFMVFVDRRPFGAGAALLLAAAKPQIGLLAWCVLLTWSLVERRWKVLSGFVLALSVSAGLAVLLDPEIFEHYHAMLGGEQISNMVMPTFGGWLRVQFKQDWLQVLPSLVGIPIAVLFYWRRRRHWRWSEHLPMLLLLSLIVAPYGWFFDETLALPALLAAAAPLQWTTQRTRVLLATFATIDLFLLVAMSTGAAAHFLGTPFIWLAYVMLAQRFVRHSPTHESAPATS